MIIRAWFTDNSTKDFTCDAWECSGDSIVLWKEWTESGTINVQTRRGAVGLISAKNLKYMEQVSEIPWPVDPRLSNPVGS